MQPTRFDARIELLDDDSPAIDGRCRARDLFILRADIVVGGENRHSASGIADAVLNLPLLGGYDDNAVPWHGVRHDRHQPLGTLTVLKAIRYIDGISVQNDSNVGAGVWQSSLKHVRRRHIDDQPRAVETLFHHLVASLVAVTSARDAAQYVLNERRNVGRFRQSRELGYRMLDRSQCARESTLCDL